MKILLIPNASAHLSQKYWNYQAKTYRARLQIPLQAHDTGMKAERVAGGRPGGRPWGREPPQVGASFPPCRRAGEQSNCLCNPGHSSQHSSLPHECYKEQMSHDATELYRLLSLSRPHSADKPRTLVTCQSVRLAVPFVPGPHWWPEELQPLHSAFLLMHGQNVLQLPKNLHLLLWCMSWHAA